MDRERIEQLVREEIQRQVGCPQKEEIVEEGMMSRKVEILAKSVGVGFFATLFAGTSLVTAAVAPFLVPVYAVFGLGATAMLARGARKSMTPLSVDLSDDIQSVVKKRDKIIARVKTEEDIKRWEPEFEKLTKKQQELGVKLEKAARKDLNIGRIDRSEYDSYVKFAKEMQKGTISSLK